MPTCLAAELVRRVSRHGLADAMGHEPRGLVRHAKRAVDLVRADALLADEQIR